MKDFRYAVVNIVDLLERKDETYNTSQYEQGMLDALKMVYENNIEELEETYSFLENNQALKRD